APIKKLRVFISLSPADHSLTSPRCTPSASEVDLHRSRDRTEVRVLETVEAGQRRRPHLATSEADLRIEARVIGDGEQITAHQAERHPVEPREEGDTRELLTAEVVAQRELAQLDEATILHEVAVRRAELAVESVRAVVAPRLLPLDRLAGLILVAVVVLEVCPLPGQVVDVEAHHRIHEAVEGEVLP